MGQFCSKGIVDGALSRPRCSRAAFWRRAMPRSLEAPEPSGLSSGEYLHRYVVLIQITQPTHHKSVVRNDPGNLTGAESVTPSPGRASSKELSGVGWPFPEPLLFFLLPQFGVATEPYCPLQL